MKDPLPFCVCEKPKTASDCPNSGYSEVVGCNLTENDCHSCGLKLPLPPQEEKCEQGNGWVSHVMSCPFKGPNTTICPNAKETPVEGGWDELFRLVKESDNGIHMAAIYKHVEDMLAEERQRGREETIEFIRRNWKPCEGMVEECVGKSREEIDAVLKAAKSPREGAEGK